MIAGYRAAGIEQTPATFELFVRRLPAGRSYLVFAGLEQAIGDLQRLAFSEAQLAAIRLLPAFASVPSESLEYLRDLRFEGDFWSVPEGTVVFAGEPIVRIAAPLAQAQWVETFLIASLCYPTLVASKAARIVESAAGRGLFEFGARRAHGPQTGMLAARAAYLAGFSGTSHVDAALRLGIPCVGTMAHSWVQAFPSEAEAFQAYTRIFSRETTTLLVDTYDTLEGVKTAAAIDPPVRAIRIDSGDLAALSRGARRILDERGRRQVQIFASGDLDEHTIHDLIDRAAPIDAFGVGTELVTSRDAPALSMVYKLVALAGQGRIKRSPGKRTYPLAKQVYRVRGTDGLFAYDRVTRADETAEPGEALLKPVLRQGRLTGPLPTLDAIREYCRGQLTSLPTELRTLDSRPSYHVDYSDALEEEADRLGLR
jgi:nicotinate phosphoribosyltransferase